MQLTSLKCLCCGVQVRGKQAEAAPCQCWTDRTDTCPITRRCVLHCPCKVCRQARHFGMRRVNWTGLRHLFFRGDTHTMCGHRLPLELPEWDDEQPLGSARVWLVRQLRPDDCERCRAAVIRQAEG